MYCLAGVQEKLGIMNNGLVYAVFSYSAARGDELSFDTGARLQVLRKGDDNEREWWWCRDDSAREGYVPRNLLGVSLCARLHFQTDLYAAVPLDSFVHDCTNEQFRTRLYF